MLWTALYGSHVSSRLLLIPLVASQFCMKLLDRYYLVAYNLRSGDEAFWLQTLASYQATGKIPIQAIAQGLGIFYLSSGTASLFHVDYGSALVALAIALGSLYVIPAFALYRILFEGNEKLALVSVLLLSMSDVMIYSSTIARPTLIGLFLLPLAVGAFQALRKRFHWSMFGLLTFVSILILFVHMPITFLVLLAVASFTLLIFGKVKRWEAVYTMFMFSSYGITLRLFLPDLDRIWRDELFSGYPLKMMSDIAGPYFFLIFPIIGLGTLGVSMLLPGLVTSVRARFRNRPIKVGLGTASVTLIALFGCLTLVFVLWRYSAYIADYYGGIGPFLLLHGWKIVFGVIALLGLRSIGAKFNRSSNDTILAWLISLTLIVVILAAYIPLWARFVGLWNLDERFSELVYYPAFYFVTVGLNCLATRFSQRRFQWILPIIALYVLPSIIVGTSMLAFL